MREIRGTLNPTLFQQFTFSFKKSSIQDICLEKLLDCKTRHPIPNWKWLGIGWKRVNLHQMEHCKPSPWWNAGVDVLYMFQKLSRANVLALIMFFYAQMRVQSKSVKTLYVLKLSITKLLLIFYLLMKKKIISL